MKEERKTDSRGEEDVLVQLVELGTLEVEVGCDASRLSEYLIACDHVILLE